MQKRAKKTTNQTRGQLDKHDFGKKLKNLGKKQKEREKKANQTRDQLDKHDFGKKLQKPRQMHKKTKKNKTKAKKKRQNNNAKKSEQKANQTSDLHFFALCFCTCIFFAFLTCIFLHYTMLFFKIKRKHNFSAVWKTRKTQVK